MDDTTRQLLHDAAPPVATGTDFDRLWVQAARQRRLQRAGRAAAAVVLVALAGLVLPFGWSGSLPLLGRGDNERIEVDPLDDLVSAPLSEWAIQERPFSSGGPVLSSYNQDYALAVFGIEDGRWCVVAAPFELTGRFDSGGVDPELADQLLCHELRAPAGGDAVGTLTAATVGERVVYWAAVARTEDMPVVETDFGHGMEVATGSFAGTGGGVPFTLWSMSRGDDVPVAFEFHSPTGETEPITVEAPEPLPAEVKD